MKIAVFTKNLSNPAYEAARLGADRAAAALGAEVLHFVPQKGDDPEEQSELIEKALALSPDAFVLTPVHPNKVDSALRRIHAAAIPIISFVNPIDAVPTVTHVGADDYQLAYGISSYLFSHVPRNAKVLVVSGPIDSVTSTERLRGFQDAALHCAGIHLTDSVAGDYTRETAFERTASWLLHNPVLDGCLVANDIMAIGVLDALDAAGRTASIVGVNAIPAAITAIGQGRMLATSDFNAMKMAYLGTECAIRHVRGEAVPARIDLPVQIVCRENCRLWDLPYMQRPVTPLQELRSQS